MTNYEKLRGLLAELFQFDQADLDFGIYRIMNQKRDEISRFLDEDLLPQVRQALEEHQATASQAGQAELQEAIKAAQALGVDPDASPKVQELKAKVGAAQDLAQLEDEVFSHLFGFFRRYYSEGDFISLRRYKEGVYAIPYEGEEVKLYWANHDQYYVKSSESFRNYTLRLPDGCQVHFRIVEAASARDNTKPADGSNRRFMLWDEQAWGEAEDDSEETDADILFGLGSEEGDDEADEVVAPSFHGPAVEEVDGALVIRFVYLADPQKRRQASINEETAEAILAAPAAKAWVTGLRTSQPTEKDPNRTLLGKHLTQHSARNTFDYFIHKDLGGFLRRELDFYIKNEVVHLDDIESETAPRVEQYLSKVRALRSVAGKIIAFLAQLEDFQKRLWLKRKFVVETNYCVTLDRVPEALYPEIVANEAQREEWVRLFAIDEIGEGLFAGGTVDEAFLRANPYLVIDTAHFPQGFCDRLLASVDDLDQQTDGLCVHGENFQALQLLGPRYRGRVRSVYIDPPFNSPSSEILYKNDYRHSTWLALLSDRIRASRGLLGDGTYVIAIDENEQERLGLLLEGTWLGSYQKACLAVRHNPRGIQGKNVSHCHEYAYVLYPSDARKYIGDRRLETPDVRNLRDSGLESDRGDARNCFYPIVVRDGAVESAGDVPTDEYHPPGVNEAKPDGSCFVWPVDTSGREKKWRYARQSVESIFPKLQVRETNGKLEVYFAKDTGTVRTIWDDARFDASEYGTKLLQAMFGTRDLDFSYPKSVHTLIETVRLTTTARSRDCVADYFAGSGTTAHAVIEANRDPEEPGNRTYVVVEMADYFDTVLLPRIKRVVYSNDWKDGRPVSRQGSSHVLKYIRLESYEDTLENLELSRTAEQQLALDVAGPEAREEYLLSYMLKMEAQGSQSLLNLDSFRQPFDYKLKVGTGVAGETRTVNVDLVETFNYLIGLTVRHIDMIRGVRVVEGTSPKGDRVLVLWRDMEEVDNDALDAWFEKQGYSTRDLEYDLIYVNGDNNLENLRRPDQTWKVRLIEPDFHRLMFDAQDV